MVPAVPELLLKSSVGTVGLFPVAEGTSWIRKLSLEKLRLGPPRTHELSLISHLPLPARPFPSFREVPFSYLRRVS